MPQLGQWLWACPFVWLFGPSHVTLRLSTLVLSWLGLAAFYDLLAETYWGGFVSGDEITVNWTDPCPCGQTTVHIARQVERYGLQRGGDDKISCAAAADAHDAALRYLTDALQ